MRSFLVAYRVLLQHSVAHKKFSQKESARTIGARERKRRENEQLANSTLYLALLFYREGRMW
jgi:hypothetical protein